MKPSAFVVPRDPYLSSRFLRSSAQDEAPGHGKDGDSKPRFFLLARYALYHGLRDLGIGQGDEVLVPAYICDAAVKAIEARGAVPVFFRVDRDCSLDWEDAEKRISARTRAVLVVHYFGFPQDLAPARELADRHKLLLVEDCAHVLHGEIGGRALGSFSDASVFSWRKFLPSFYGAGLVLNSPTPMGPLELRREPFSFDLKIMKSLIDDLWPDNGNSSWPHSLLHRSADGLKWIRGRWTDSRSQQDQQGPALETNTSDFDLRLANSALSPISAFVLRHSDMPAIAEKRAANFKRLAERLAHIPGVRPLFTSFPEKNAPLYFPLFFSNLSRAHRQVRELGIPATAWDGVRPAAVSDNGFPDAAFLYENLAFLPVHQNLQDRDLDQIADVVKKVRQQNTRAVAVQMGPAHPSAPDTTAQASAVPQGSLTKKNSAEAAVCRRKVLIVAYHFPPLTGSSGLLRALKYCRYLPENGWLPSVLTVHPRVYERVDKSQLDEIPEQVQVIRATALDARKHLSLRGRYFAWTALPDRWVSWCVSAVPRGWLQMHRSKTDVILTTFPIASAVLIGYLLHRISGVPWVADFRDSMTEEDYPRDPRTRRVVRWLEKKAVREASRLIFTARSTMQMYLDRYPDLPAAKCVVIANGYDEQDFLALTPEPQPNARLRLQHSGIIYPEERNPAAFFAALSRLKKENQISASLLSVDLRACGNEERYREMVRDLGIEDLVSFLPALPYRESLEDGYRSDMLLLLQGGSCDHQIPAKAYEYLRLGKPILALTTSSGDTAALLEECGGATIIDLDDEEAIYKKLPEVLASVQAGTHPLPQMEAVSRYSRQSQARQLAECLSDAIDGHPAGDVTADVKRAGARC
jgi:dTDP-4-amino-4,6-dideoxygalactose transaminase/glycosyltransferase involved in cell wall biosynthesis